jgi:hypothetical protein
MGATGRGVERDFFAARPTTIEVIGTNMSTVAGGVAAAHIRIYTGTNGRLSANLAPTTIPMTIPTDAEDMATIPTDAGAMVDRRVTAQFPMPGRDVSADMPMAMGETIRAAKDGEARARATTSREDLTTRIRDWKSGCPRRAGPHYNGRRTTRERRCKRRCTTRTREAPCPPAGACRRNYSDGPGRPHAPGGTRTRTAQHERAVQSQRPETTTNRREDGLMGPAPNNELKSVNNQPKIFRS